MPLVPIGFGLGAACGGIAGLLTTVFGGGGALFLMPVLVLLFERPVADAAGISLAAVFASGLVGLLGHWRHGHVRTRIAVPFGVPAIGGAFVGTALHALITPRTAMFLLAGVLYLAAARMAIGRPPSEQSEEGDGIGAPVLAGLGLLVGVLAGLLGVSGGFLVVPVLVWGARLNMCEAIGTSVAIVTLTAGSGACAHLLEGHIPAAQAAIVAAGAIGGGLLGVPLVGKLPDRPMRLGFAGFIALAGAYILFRTI